MTITPGQPMSANDFLQNHTDPANPGDDENKGVKLNQDGEIEMEFVKTNEPGGVPVLDANNNVEKTNLPMIYPIGAILDMPLSQADYDLEAQTNQEWLKANGRKMSGGTEFLPLWNVYGNKFGAGGVKKSFNDYKTNGSGFYNNTFRALVRDFSNPNKFFIAYGNYRRVNEYEWDPATKQFNYLRQLTMPSGDSDLYQEYDDPYQAIRYSWHKVAVSGLYFFVKNGQYIYIYKRNSATSTTFTYKTNLNTGNSSTNYAPNFKIFKETSQYIYFSHYRTNGDTKVSFNYKYDKNNDTVAPVSVASQSNPSYETVGNFMIARKGGTTSSDISIYSVDDNLVMSEVFNVGTSHGRLWRSWTHKTKDEFIFFSETQKLVRVYKNGGSWLVEVLKTGVDKKGGSSGEFINYYDDIFIDHISNYDTRNIAIRTNGVEVSYISNNSNMCSTIILDTNLLIAVYKNQYWLIYDPKYTAEFDAVDVYIPNIADTTPSSTGNGYSYIKAK